MASMKKSLPFNSPYLPNFQVVEQRDGSISRFPHTDQLPKLLRALNHEFTTGLPAKLARVDHRANDYMKLQKHRAALMYCSYINQARRDGLRLRALLDRNLVARISIVQQITEHTDRGPLHRFKFYAGDDFFTELYLNGRRISLAKHVLDRFTERVPNPLGTDLTNFLNVFFGAPAMVMESNKRTAFVFPHDGSVLAFPVRLSETEYFLPTCLTGNEINDMDMVLPPIAYTWLYDPVYKMPEIRNWDTIGWSMALIRDWNQKVQLQLKEPAPMQTKPWLSLADKVFDAVKLEGHGAGSRFIFWDNIPGPGCIKLLPGEPETRYVVLENLKVWRPDVDWDRVVPAHKAAHPDWYGGGQTG